MRWFAKADGSFMNRQYKTHYIGVPDSPDEGNYIRVDREGVVRHTAVRSIVGMTDTRQALRNVANGLWIEASDPRIPEVLVILGEVGEAR